MKTAQKIGSYAILVIFAAALMINGDADILGRISIGRFPEKDFYHVYPNAEKISNIADSRWSIYGRSDLVKYSNQDRVRQLFIDGAAGTQMFRFNGNIRNPDLMLQNLLMSQSSSIPFLFLSKAERNNMMVIGPGGGKEVLTGLWAGVEQITGVEINPDFVRIVKKYRDFNGGIYTDFPNVQIHVAEGRHYIKNTSEYFDLIVMALPSTEQLQSIDHFAASENYLLTVEALQDYLKILTPEGRLIFTVHNRWELMRLITTTIKAFDQRGMDMRQILNHFIVLEQDYAPTVVIKKNIFTNEDINRIQSVINTIPKELPQVTYLPYHLDEIPDTPINNLLKQIQNDAANFQNYIDQHQYNISPCFDNSPYFYKIKKGVPADYLWLLAGISFVNVVVVALPFSGIRKTLKKDKMNPLLMSLMIFICIGLGFMILEISLFQKLVLYLGSPTVSLSILLGSLLIGMGTGSYYGRRFYAGHTIKRLYVTSLSIVGSGIILFIFYPLILNYLLSYSQLLRSIICFFMLVPFGFLLGIPFPSAIQMLEKSGLKQYIPWMYGVNGTMSILGSILAVIFSITFGFTVSFFVGLTFYALVFFLTRLWAQR
ncbi:MAG: hypothetical protein U5R06_14130 [candidate division KSB1 bacterium]|nr:hypothetical protein [candidate division KSB1 bacterium]